MGVSCVLAYTTGFANRASPILLMRFPDIAARMESCATYLEALFVGLLEPLYVKRKGFMLSPSTNRSHASKVPLNARVRPNQRG